MGGIFHSVGQVFEWSLLLHSFWLFFSEDKTGGQHPLSKIKMSWECLSTNKCCLVISEVLGIKGLVPVCGYPVLSQQIPVAQPKRIIWGCANGVGKEPLSCSSEFQSCSARLRMKKLSWHSYGNKKQTGERWKGWFCLAKESSKCCCCPQQYSASLVQ